MEEARRAQSIAYATSFVVKDSKGSLIHVSGYNSKASVQFIQIHDAAALPADTAIPIAVITAAATSNFAFPPWLAKYPFQLGIVLCNSSTGPTKTIGSADCWFNALYE